jgi:hypothetical protein
LAEASFKPLRLRCTDACGTRFSGLGISAGGRGELCPGPPSNLSDTEIANSRRPCCVLEVVFLAEYLMEVWSCTIAPRPGGWNDEGEQFRHMTVHRFMLACPARYFPPSPSPLPFSRSSHHLVASYMRTCRGESRFFSSHLASLLARVCLTQSVAYFCPPCVGLSRLYETYSTDVVSTLTCLRALLDFAVWSEDRRSIHVTRLPPFLPSPSLTPPRQRSHRPHQDHREHLARAPTRYAEGGSFGLGILGGNEEDAAREERAPNL